MLQQGIYIYGVIEEPEEKKVTPDGIDGKEVTTVNYKELAAVVSNAPLVSYDRFNEQLHVSALKAHQLVLESIFRDYTVIPMGFGIIARSENDVIKLLETAYTDFKDTLREIGNKIELNIQVSCDTDKVLNEILTNDAAVKRLSEELCSASTDDADRIKLELGKTGVSVIYELIAKYREDILDTLKEVAISSCPGKLSNSQVIVNESFLVERAREAEFDQEVNRLANKYEDSLKFKYIGPMPPYSFVNLEASVVNADKVDWAKSLLGLGESVTLREVKSAYREMAKKYHPDSNGHDPARVAKFREVTEASEILLKCAKSLPPVENGRYSFSRDQIEDVIVVTRRR